MSEQPLRPIGHVDLPASIGKGAFDHAAVHAASGHVYVAHTANDAVDVFDPASARHLYSVRDLAGVAGALVSDEAQLIFTSNRAEHTVGIFAPGADPAVSKIAVGGRHPNGLAYDHRRRTLLAANVGDPAIPGSHTLSMLDLEARAVRAEIPVPGRTRWAIYDPDAEAFYVNIAAPAEIAVIDAKAPQAIARVLAVPAVGPHGLDLDPDTGRLFCACDDGTLVVLEARSGKLLGQQQLSGTPDVIFFNRRCRELYVAIGDPGVIDVFDTARLRQIARVPTEPGAHTLALSPAGDWLCAVLPGTHRAAMFALGAG